MYFLKNYENWNYIEIEFNSDELILEYKNNNSYINYNKKNQNEENRDEEEVKIKVSFSNIIERKVADYISKLLNVQVDLNLFNFNNKYPEICDLCFSYNNVTINCEIRSSLNEPEIKNQLKLSLIGSYTNSVKKKEPKKDLYMQVFWNQTFEEIKNIILLNELNKKISFNLVGFAFYNDFKKHNSKNLNQKNTSYLLINPITKTRNVENFRNEIENYSVKKSEYFKNKIGLNIFNIINNIKEDNIVYLLKDIENDKRFLRFINKNNISKDIYISILDNKNELSKEDIKDNIFYIDIKNKKTFFQFQINKEDNKENGIKNFSKKFSNIVKIEENKKRIINRNKR